MVNYAILGLYLGLVGITTIYLTWLYSARTVAVVSKMEGKEEKRDFYRHYTVPKFWAILAFHLGATAIGLVFLYFSPVAPVLNSW